MTYYYSNIQNWIEHQFEEYIDSINDDKEQLHNFITDVLYSPTTMEDFMADFLQHVDYKIYPELVCAIFNTINWKLVKKNIEDYIEFNVHINNEINNSIQE